MKRLDAYQVISHDGALPLDLWRTNGSEIRRINGLFTISQCCLRETLVIVYFINTKGGSPFFSKLLVHFYILEPLGGVTVTVQGRLLTNGPHKLKGHIVFFIFGPHATSILPSKQEQELASPGTDEA